VATSPAELLQRRNLDRYRQEHSALYQLIKLTPSQQCGMANRQAHDMVDRHGKARPWSATAARELTRAPGHRYATRTLCHSGAAAADRNARRTRRSGRF